MPVQLRIADDRKPIHWHGRTMAGLQIMDYLPACAFLAFVYFLGEMLVMEKTSRNYLLGAVFLAYSGILIRAWLLFTQRMHLVPYLYEFSLPFLFLFGPLLRQYFKYSVMPGGRSGSRQRMWLLHLLPAVVATAMLLPDWMQSNEEKVGRILALYQGKADFPGILLFPLGLFHTAAYIVWTLIDIRRVFTLENLRREGVIRASILFLGLIATGCSIALAALFSGHPEWLAISITFIAINAPLVYIVQRRYPQFLLDLETIVRREKERSRYQKSRLSGIDVNGLERGLRDLMEDRQAYRQEDLTLAMLADELEISAHQLSEYLNHQLNVNFAGYVNEYRVRAAEKLLGDEPGKTILSVAYDVGFNSKTAFNDAFMRHRKMSPGQYRKTLKS